MKSFLSTSLVLLFCLALSCDAKSVDFSKESANDGIAKDINHKAKRSADVELDNLLNELLSDEELLNLPFHDKEKVQSSPLLQYLLMRKPNLVHIMQEKRNTDYRPRLGRRSNEETEQPKPYDVLFTPRMGKRSEILTNYTPRLGRSVISE